MQHVTRFELYGLAVLLLVCALATWRGGMTERRITAVIAVAWVASLVLDDDASRQVQWTLFGIDVVLAVWLVAEAIFGRRLWIAIAAGAQLMIVLTHVAFAANRHIVQEAFFSAYYVWSYVVLLAVVLGCLTTRRDSLSQSSQG